MKKPEPQTVKTPPPEPAKVVTSAPPRPKKTAVDAPVGMSALEAEAWAKGYNDALRG